MNECEQYSIYSISIYTHLLRCLVSVESFLLSFCGVFSSLALSVCVCDTNVAGLLKNESGT